MLNFGISVIVLANLIIYIGNIEKCQEKIMVFAIIL